MVIVEICADSWEGVVEAIRAGADRIELCSDLVNDGLSPSVDLLESALELAGRHEVVVFPMVRCRAGDFCYTDDEKKRMIEEGLEFVRMGAPGIVVGALTVDIRPDIEFISKFAIELRALDPKVEITYHKAIDAVKLVEGESLASVGGLLEPYCGRVLTSGGRPTAVEGAEEIRHMVDRKRRPVPIAAGKVRAGNAVEILKLSGATEVHSRSTDICPALGKRKRIVYCYPYSISSELDYCTKENKL
jgi:copper homeostasis protein